MKKIALIAMAFAFAALVTGMLAAQDESLADRARAAQKNKAGRPTAKKVYTDDDVPHVDRLSTVPAESSADEKATPASEKDQPAATDEEGKGEESAKKPAKPAEAEKPAPKKDDAEAKQKDWESWKAKIQAQKDVITLAGKELDILQREFKLRQAAFYGDAAQRMQNAAAWDREDNNFRDQIDKKQKEVDSAKAKLEQIQEQARKAGVPSSYRD